MTPKQQTQLITRQADFIRETREELVLDLGVIEQTGGVAMKTYTHDVLEELPEDTRTLAEKQRDALLAFANTVTGIAGRDDDKLVLPTIGQWERIAKEARYAIAAVESGKVPS